MSLQLKAQSTIDNGLLEERWADSVYQSLTLEQRIAQLIFVRANYSGQPYLKVIDTLIMKYNIGGVVFFKGDPISQAIQTNYWNSLSSTPLFVSIDAEWGLGMRLKKFHKISSSNDVGCNF